MFLRFQSASCSILTFSRLRRSSCEAYSRITGIYSGVYFQSLHTESCTHHRSILTALPISVSNHASLPPFPTSSRSHHPRPNPHQPLLQNSSHRLSPLHLSKHRIHPQRHNCQRPTCQRTQRPRHYIPHTKHALHTIHRHATSQRCSRCN